MELNFRNEGGRQLVTMDVILNCVKREAPSTPPPPTPTRPKYGKLVNANNTVASSAKLPQLPVDDGLVRDHWRLISAVMAWPSSAYDTPVLVDYSHKGGSVLREAVAIINREKPHLMKGHSVEVTDIVGFIENAYWEQSTDIEPGINATIVADPEIDNETAMKLKKGYISSGSIGVSMDLEPSHPKMQLAQFLKLQGQTVNGQIVRLLPVKTRAVRHMGLIPSGLGADPNAGKRVVNHSSPITTKPNRKRITLTQAEEMLGMSRDKIREIFRNTGELIVYRNDGTVPMPELYMYEDEVLKYQLEHGRATNTATRRSVEPADWVSSDFLPERKPPVMHTLDISQAANMIGISRSDLYWMCRSGKGPKYSDPCGLRQYTFNREELQQWIESRKPAPKRDLNTNTMNLANAARYLKVREWHLEKACCQGLVSYVKDELMRYWFNEADLAEYAKTLPALDLQYDRGHSRPIPGLDGKAKAEPKWDLTNVWWRTEA